MVKIFFVDRSKCRFVSFHSNGFDFYMKPDCELLYVNGVNTFDISDDASMQDNLQFSIIEDVSNISDLELHCPSGNIPLQDPQNGWMNYIESVLENYNLLITRALTLNEIHITVVPSGPHSVDGMHIFDVKIVFVNLKQCRFVSFCSNGIDFHVGDDCEVLEVQSSLQDIDLVRAVNTSSFLPVRYVHNTSDLVLECFGGNLNLKCPARSWMSYISSVLPYKNVGKLFEYSTQFNGQFETDHAIPRKIFTFSNIRFIRASSHPRGSDMAILNVNILFDNTTECRFVSFSKNGNEFVVRKFCKAIKVVGFSQKNIISKLVPRFKGLEPCMNEESVVEYEPPYNSKVYDALTKFVFSPTQDVVNTSDLKLHCPEGDLCLKCPDIGWGAYIHSVLPLDRPGGQNL